MRTAFLLPTICGLLLLGSCEKMPERLLLITPEAAVDRAVVEDLAELLEGRVRVTLELSEEPLSEEAALDAVVSGAADLAVVSNNLPFRDDIATVLPLYPAVLHVAHRAEMDALPGPELLRGKRIYAGSEGSASRLVFRRILERFGLDESDINYVTESDGPPDVIVVFAPISPRRAMDLPGFRLVSLGQPEAIGSGSTVIDTAVLLNPHFRPFIIPVGTYGEATPEPIATIAVDRVLIASRDLESAVVYDLVNEILRLRPALAAQNPGLFQELTDDFETDRSRFVVHAGTQDYIQRSEPSFYERYSGIAEVLVTLLIGLSSATFAGFQILQRRRKNRIDTFYSRTIAISRSIADLSSASDRQRAIDAVRKLQADAFDLLIVERLSADESFRIFVTLSNDVLRELESNDVP